MRRWAPPLACLLGLALLTTGCSGDDGAATPTGSAASGLAGKDLSGTTSDPVILTAVGEYKTYATGQIDDAIRLTKVLTDAVRAGNLPAAQTAYAPSRVPWERIEPLAGLVEEIDGKVDARVDDFANENDPMPASRR